MLHLNEYKVQTASCPTISSHANTASSSATLSTELTSNSRLGDTMPTQINNPASQSQACNTTNNKQSTFLLPTAEVEIEDIRGYLKKESNSPGLWQRDQLNLGS